MTFSFCKLAVVAATFVLPVLAPGNSQAATMIVVNADGVGEGFNDPTPASPVGGNSGTTIGAQRLIAFQRAADIWGGLLVSNVPVRIRAQFNPLSCTTNSAVLGSAGPTTVSRDFTGAPVAATWYPIALANALRGIDLDPSGDDITAQFSSTIGTPGCLQSSGWYYGLDGNPPSGRIDFVTVLLHELGHGLGFLTLVDLATGAKSLGFDDVFMRNLESHGASPSAYPSMSNAQRVAASKATGNLHWVGANVRAAGSVLSAGRVGDHVSMYAPNPQESGSSVSHWDTALFPNQLMEPSYTQPLHNPVLELAAFRDIGWTTSGGGPAPVPGTGAVAHDFDGDAKSDILWRRSDGTSAIWLMNGMSPKASTPIGEVDTSWQIVRTGDFNGDGKVDMLWRRSDGNLAIWLMNGFSVAATTTFGVVDPSWQVVGTGDFDGDGKSDIVWRRTDGTLAVWLINGLGVKATGTLGAVDTSWQVVATGDVDGDGAADLVWRRNDGNLAFWAMSGLGVRGSTTFGQVDTSWQVATTADFDGDGKADLLWRRSDGNVAIWAMSGFSIKASVALGATSNAWQIAGTGDFNGDGRGDILWRDTSGTVGIWQMNGLSVASAQGVAVVTTDWTIQK